MFWTWVLVWVYVWDQLRWFGRRLRQCEGSKSRTAVLLALCLYLVPAMLAAHELLSR